MDETKTFKVEDGRLIFKNFSGKEGPYNREGELSFSVILDEDSAARMAADGWNVKRLKPRDDEEVGAPFIPVTVNFKNRPPRVVMITTTSRTNLDESSIGVLDWADIRTVDLICRAYEWGPINGKYGITAYLKTMFVTIDEDDLERKYAANELEGS